MHRGAGGHPSKLGLCLSPQLASIFYKEMRNLTRAVIYITKIGEISIGQLY